jgi:hypothetical protein
MMMFIIETRKTELYDTVSYVSYNSVQPISIITNPRAENEILQGGLYVLVFLCNSE